MSRSYTLVEAPFHMGVEGVAVGAGPRCILEAGADKVLATRGIPAQVVHTRRMGNPATDLDAVVDLNRQIRHAVRQAVDQDTVPVTLAGNCNSCLGTLGGLDPDRLGIVWLDAHGDFHTPETSVSGLLDGMSLAIALGHCHGGLRERIGIETCVAERDTLLLAVRDLDPMEPERLAQSAVTVRPYDRLDDVPDLLADLRSRVGRIYLHLDVDFLDPDLSPGVNFRGPGGLSLDEARELLEDILKALPLAAVNLTNYNPTHDRDGRTLSCALQLLTTIASL